MAVRPIITDQEHKILRGKAKRVGRIDDSVRRLIDDMVETMRQAPGVGLSAPHWQGPVTRAASVVVKGRDRNGKEIRIKAEGWLGRIFQHECDHLDGTLFLDRVQDRSQIHWVEPEEQVRA